MKADSYEDLLREITKEVEVYEDDLISTIGDTGYYRDNTIYIERTLSESDKRERLYEEYGHHRTTIGIILDQSKTMNRQQERSARTFGQELALSLDDIINCYRNGIEYYWECAEYLDFSEEFVYEAVKALKNKLGEIIYYKNYIIRFVTETLLNIETKIG
ncbi:ImmA/IrrE family metallo-endopeptidase [Enterococcus sp. BWM-S5]|uniref:ImmA/IrrE family metallo-endopeptidase n=1 Tax=Enterococcus larvae TaxID=2794352 RepID=A0ABS4CII9_9ENTE|nr:ImmA/IrrE family metallo-endopeptidase [Enterococcus larvae]MBP1046441.1 ImmA/IrrE family metallo-endopeptidase [Enterococcus larvae]